MANPKWTLISPILLLVAATSCGPSVYKSKKSGSSGQNGIDPNALVNNVDISPGQAPAQVRIDGTGYGSYSVTVNARNVLKVRFIPGKQNRVAEDGNFYPYSMLGVYIGVDNYIQPTEHLLNGYSGGSATQSSIIDLSSSFARTCDSSDPDCREQVTITVSKPNNDDECLNKGYLYCPKTKVPEGHPWNGTLVIQTDDTSAI